MPSAPDGIQLLTGLGLTTRQAKVYLSLTQCGAPSVKEISKASNIPREDLYRILQVLQNLGLVEKRITSPVSYEAIPLSEALSFLYERKINQTMELQYEAKKFFEKYMQNFQPKRTSEDAQFVLIPEKEAVIARRKKSIDSANNTIDIINSWRRFAFSLQVYAKEADNAMDRGVKIRVITQKPKEPNLLSKATEGLRKKPILEIRYAQTPPSALIDIFDDKEVFFLVNEEADLGKSPALWSNNRGLMTVARSYFDMLWFSLVE
ncbi:MAG: TrmB family transcriptional regulator [Candidatus Bathyarchaeia archaeon]|jgi:sugar-specific transcriptional regulator TrmB